MNRFLFMAVVVMAGTWRGLAGDLPHFANDQEADKWLRETSPTYLTIAKSLDRRGGYAIGPMGPNHDVDHPKAQTVWGKDQPEIKIREDLDEPTRLSALIFELCNASQEGKVRDLDEATRAHQIKSADEYADLFMLIEWKSNVMHHDVLADIDKAVNGVPPAMYQVFSPDIKTFADYESPSPYDFLRGQEGSDYRKYYLQCFEQVSHSR